MTAPQSLRCCPAGHEGARTCRPGAPSGLGRPGAGPVLPLARGFTLVEVLVALLVLALMAGMAWQGVDGIVRTREASQARLEQTLRLNTVLGQWEKDLASVQETGAVPALTFDGATLRLTRHSDTVAGSGVQVVAWTLRPDARGTAWLRWAGPIVTRKAELQESWMASQQLIGTEPGQLHVLEGLTGWQVYYFLGNAWANAQSTGNVAPPGLGASAPLPRQALPSGVRIVLAFAPGSGFGGALTRDALVSP
jgi:general secretion pathway protein J